MQKFLIISCLALVASGCKEKFYADIPSPATGYLIAEGIIEIGNPAVTTIRLSRTSALDDPEVQFEDNGTVYIENEYGTKYELRHTDSGRFVSQPIVLPPGMGYRIHVFTQGGEYYSGFTEAKISPEIDSLFWAPKNDGIEIQLNTQDASNKSRYYYWNFVETWQYSAPFYATEKYDTVLNAVVPRGPADPEIYTCWKTMPSTTIAIGSTVKLTRDFLYAHPVAYVSASNTNKLVQKYSILVKQSVLSAEAYEYLDRMQKNTEKTGTVFDRQPSELRGNIYNATDTTEAVMGFITASSITEKRLFVDRSELPPFRVTTLYENCIEDTLRSQPSADQLFRYQVYLPTNWVPLPTSGTFPVFALLYSQNFCVDCRKLGGINQKPSFWP